MTDVSFGQSPTTVSARLAEFILRGAEVGGDVRTVSGWARAVGASSSSLRQCCRLAGVKPKDARDFTRVLGALQRADKSDRLSVVLDVADPRTLSALLSRAGIADQQAQQAAAVETFLEQQSFIPSHCPAVGRIRSLLTARRPTGHV